MVNEFLLEYMDIIGNKINFLIKNYRQVKVFNIYFDCQNI